jgi:hypothetical protein
MVNCHHFQNAHPAYLNIDEDHAFNAFNSDFHHQDNLIFFED